MDRRGVRTVAWGACLALALLGTVTFAAAAAKRRPRRPDLEVTSVGDPPAQLSPGSTFTARDTTKNIGKGKARASHTSYFLSVDRTLGHGDVALGTRTVGSLKHDKSSTGSARVTVPASAGSGTYHMLACADAARAVKESSERNNCRASAKSTKVAASSSGIPPPGYFPRPSHPTTVTPVTEPGNAVSALITSDGGGMLTATDAAGVKYTLNIPAGALISDETITMTPVSSIGGSPLGSLIGAVEITPHGLQLQKTATLTIVPTSPIQLTSQAGFDAYEGGEDFGLYPLDPGAGIVMRLNHFSTFGVANATDAAVQTMLSLMPVRTQAQWQQIAADIFREARETGQPINTTRLAAVSLAYYRDVIKPRVDHALTDDTYADSALDELLNWARNMVVLGIDDHPYVKPLFSGWADLFQKIFQNAVKQRYQRCVQTDDLTEVQRLIAGARQMLLLGLDPGDAAALGQKCGHLELDVATTSEHVLQTGDDRITTDITVEDDVPLLVTGNGLQYSGDQSPDYTNWQIALQYGSGATADGTAVDVRSRVGLLLSYKVNEQTDENTGRTIRTVPDPLVDLRFDPGHTRELYTYPGGGQGTETLWNDTWHDGHLAELVEDTNFYEPENWESFHPGSGQLIASKSYPTRIFCHHNYPGCTPSFDTITETTTLKLYHRPQG